MAFYKYKLADTSLIEVLTTCKKEVNDQAYLCSLIKGRVNFEGYIFAQKTFFMKTSNLKTNLDQQVY